LLPYRDLAAFLVAIRLKKCFFKGFNYPFPLEKQVQIQSKSKVPFER